MPVITNLHGTLRKYLPAGSKGNVITVEVPDEAPLPTSSSASTFRAHGRMFVSGDEHLDSTALLREGQELNLFPPLAGGA